MTMASGRWKLRRGRSVASARGRYDLRRMQQAKPSALRNCCCATRSVCRAAIGLREQSASGVMMIPVPKSGVLERIEGEDAACSVPGITALEITARLHDYIAAWPEGSSYLGFLFATGNSAGEVEEAIRAAHGKLHLGLAPRLPVEHPSTGRLPSAVD